MPGLISISLNNVRFRAYHGLYPEERQKGNDFVVNMEVSYQPGEGIITRLENTIDYASLFEVINETMQHPVDLLETLVQTIAYAAQKKFPEIRTATVSVEKLNPPIDKFTGSSAVRFTCEF